MSKIKNKIQKAFNNIVLPDFNMNELKKRKGMVLVKKEEKKSKKGLFVGLSTCLAVCVCLFLGVFYFNNNMKVASIIGIDVNPSIALTVNKKEKVLSVKANNEDARKILEDMDLEGSDMNVAINALIGSMVKNGYIDELANSILISVDSKNSEESEVLRKKIVDELSGYLTNNNLSVVSQNISSTSEEEALAQEYGISVGKLELIEKLIAKNNLYTYDQLKDLSINELNLLLGSTRDDVTTSGTVSDKAYIGRDKALEVALDHANVSNPTWSSVEMDYDDGAMVYEVDFVSNNKEYEYEINATTGDVIKVDQEYDDDNNQMNNSNQTSSNNNSNNNQNTSNNNSSSNDNQSTNNNANNTTTNTTNITTTISGYNTEAQSILNSINNLGTSVNRSEGVTVYREWEPKIEILEEKVDNYDDRLESMYKRGEISYSNYHDYEYQLEHIENILERAEETLERKTYYDD